MKPDRYDENGVPVFTAESTFRPGENVYIHLSTDAPEFVGILHKHEFIEIVYVLSGSAIHETTGGSYPVGRGDLVVINYDTPHAFHADAGEESFTAYDLMFTPDFLDASLIRASGFDEMCSEFLFYSLFPEQQTLGPNLHLSGQSYGTFGELYSKIYLEYTGRQKGYEELIRAYIVELVIKLFRKMESTAVGKLTARQKDAVGKMLAFLRENYGTHITLGDLAAHIFLSKDYLNRIFREATGMPVNAFLQKTCVEESCRLLRQTDRTVADIAVSCGFGDSKSFYAAFKKIMGETPGEYRRHSVP